MPSQGKHPIPYSICPPPLWRRPHLLAATLAPMPKPSSSWSSLPHSHRRTLCYPCFHSLCVLPLLNHLMLLPPVQCLPDLNSPGLKSWGLSGSSKVSVFSSFSCSAANSVPSLGMKLRRCLVWNIPSNGYLPKSQACRS